MLLKKWDVLPEELRCEEVRRYYDTLCHHRAGLFLKRALDILGSLVLLALLSPLFLVLSVVIAADSPGGVFFRQVRVTAYGREFRIYKFRTMVQNAEKLGTQVTTAGDCRITRVGGFLRDTRLDEIPQLINILIGDMTFVGTRPEVPRYVRQYIPAMRATLLLPAGVTSEASIYYKDENRLLDAAGDVDKTYVEEVLPGKMRYNLRMLEHFSIFSDFRVLIQTVLAVLGKDYPPDADTEQGA